MKPESKRGISRRAALQLVAGLGISSATMSRALAVEIEQGTLDADSIARAQWVSGVELSEEQQKSLVRSVTRLQRQLEQLRSVELDADIAPSVNFSPWPDAYERDQATYRNDVVSTVQARRVRGRRLPTSETEIAFASIPVLAEMLRRRQISSLELTKLFLARLETFGPQLNCVVTLTPEIALRQAKQADRELAAGRIRGPLHGLPWGAKDLIAVAGYPTTWGAEAYRDQVRSTTATVAERLEEAGAILVGKLTLGAIAMGDEWFGGRTNNPWNLEEGSSGSSAGSAAAVAAGLLPFAIGSETLGSIVSPSRRCSTTGLRPTFGRVPRSGCMPLAWSFDKLGPITRSVEDAALVFASIHGADGKDPTAVTRPFAWPINVDLRTVHVGFTGDRAGRVDLDALEELGASLVPVQLPEQFPLGALTMMLDVESASMFYDLWKDGNEQGLFRWARIWQTASFVPAIDYVRAARVRTLVMQQMESLMQQVDVLVGTNDLVLTNLTGHPTVVMPYRSSRPPSENSRETAEASETAEQAPTQSPAAGLTQPGSITITGRLHDETRLLVIADAVQRKLNHHLDRPPLFNRSVAEGPVTQPAVDDAPSPT